MVPFVSSSVSPSGNDSDSLLGIGTAVLDIPVKPFFSGNDSDSLLGIGTQAQQPLPEMILTPF